MPESLALAGVTAMTAAQLERLQEHLQRLRLFKSRDRLEALLQEATGKELPPRSASATSRDTAGSEPDCIRCA
jgi:hypothetical protein